MQGQFRAAAMKDNNEAEKAGYPNARFAPTGNETVGKPFPLFRQSGAYFTDWSSSGQTNSLYNLQRNVKTDSLMASNAMQSDAVSQATQQNVAMVNRTQTLSNNGQPVACRNDADCNPYPGTTCNPQYQDWDSAAGNQGNFCSYTVYPEIGEEGFKRKTTNQGGIGRACTHNGDCGEGYFCNNETDVFGKNIQQTGFCSQTYNCPDGTKKFMGYPYGAGEPVVPPKNQNNNGRGYSSKEECTNNSLAQQNCVQNKGRWFATYPGVCPVVPSLRRGANPLGAFSTSPPSQQAIIMPGYATTGPSKFSSAPQAFSAWNMNAVSSKYNEEKSPLQYSLSINPRPKN